jgi:hypothetical protein
MPELGVEQVKNVNGEKLLEREVGEQSESNLVLNQFMGAECGYARMLVRTRVVLSTVPYHTRTI